MVTRTTTGTKAVWGRDSAGKRIIVANVPVKTTYSDSKGGNTLVTTTNSKTGEKISEQTIMRQGESGRGRVTGISGGAILEQETTTTTTTKPQQEVLTADKLKQLTDEKNRVNDVSVATAQGYYYGPGGGTFKNKFFSIAGQKERIANVGTFVQKIANPLNENTKVGKVGNLIISPLIPNTEKTLRVIPGIGISTFGKNTLEFVANKPLIGVPVVAGVAVTPVLNKFALGALTIEGTTFTTKEVLKSDVLAKKFGTTKAEYKSYLRSPDSIENKKIVYGTISQKTNGFFRSFSAGISPMTAPTKVKQEAFQNVYDNYIQQGKSPLEAERLSKLAIRDYKTSNIVETAGIITINAVSNKMGSVLLGKSTKVASVLGTSGARIFKSAKYAVKPSNFISKTRLGALALPGAYEGAYSVDIAETQRFGKAKGKDVFFGASVGAISAPLVQIGIDKPINKIVTKVGLFKGRIASASVLESNKKGFGLFKSRAVQGLAYATDPAEAPGDILDSISTKTANKIRVNSFSNVFSNTNTKNNPFGNTKSQSFTEIMPKTFTDVSTQTQVNTRVNNNVFSYDRVGKPKGLVNSRVNAQTNIEPVPKPFTFIQVNTKTNTMPSLFNNVNTNLETNTNTNPFVNVNPETNTNLFVNPRMPIAFPGGGFSKGKNMFGKSMLKQSKGYTPTLFSSTLGIKGSTKTSRSRKQSGLDIRPI